ncbi:abhydrolase domain containing protein [Perkinsela sp. CCAP 1560/4]|nr:abhydrolase domain containing protein [Perkinsela sp. CCAP 1560/4]|eukprot:KNH09696.1 abhydrolase domain containing protein [Perkinsela sp. CCAP 1560/4]
MEELHQRPYRPKWYSWRPTSAEQAIQAEKDVLRCINGYYQQCEIAGLNTIFWDPTNPLWTDYDATVTLRKVPIFMLHGLGGGCALWVGIWRSLIDEGYAPYAVDLPGFARSRAVPFTARSLDEVLSYFLSQLEEWITASGITSPFILMGHSFGAYIATHLATGDPQRVHNLILVDPWGIPDVNRKQQKTLLKSLPLLLQGLFSIMNSFPPLHLLRASGPWGPHLLPNWRPTLADGYRELIGDPHVLFDYIFHMNSGSPLGERAFHRLMEGPACAKRPIEKEFEQLFAASQHDLPIAFIYGQDTWMDISCALRLQKRYKGLIRVFAIPGAGHNVFQDQPKLFFETLIRYLEQPQKGLGQ